MKSPQKLARAHIEASYITFDIRHRARPHADRVRWSYNRYIVHDKRWSRRAYVDILKPFGVAQPLEQIHSTVITKIRVGIASFGIQGNQLKTGCNVQNP